MDSWYILVRHSLEAPTALHQELTPPGLPPARPQNDPFPDAPLTPLSRRPLPPLTPSPRSVLASFVGAAAKLLMRNSHLIMDENGNREAVSAATKAKARLMMSVAMVGMVVINPVCGVMAMNYAEPSLIAPFAGLTLVWVVVFSKKMTGEEPTGWQKLAAGLIVAGEVIVTLGGDKGDETDFGLAEFGEIYRETKMIL